MKRNQFQRESNVQSIAKVLELEKAKQDSALFHIMALVNHSCVKNCSHQVIGDYMFLMAIRDIKEGEELFISYIDPLSPLEMRKALFKNFEFECKCEMCQVQEKIMAEPLAKELPKSEDLYNPDKVMDAFESISKFKEL